MIPFVPMIPGTYRDGGAQTRVILVGVGPSSAGGASVIAIDVATGIVGYYPSDLVKADPDWCAHYANHKLM
jgi:hypothetical protein